MTKVKKLHQENDGLIYKVQSVRYVTPEKPWDPGIPMNIDLNMTELSRSVQLVQKFFGRMIQVHDMKFK